MSMRKRYTLPQAVLAEAPHYKNDFPGGCPLGDECPCWQEGYVQGRAESDWLPRREHGRHYSDNSDGET